MAHLLVGFGATALIIRIENRYERHLTRIRAKLQLYYEERATARIPSGVRAVVLAMPVFSGFS